MSAALKPWLILAVIFVAGAMTGTAITMVCSGQFTHSAGAPPGPPDEHMWMMHLTRQLNLTADQQAKIEPIMRDTAAQLQKIHNDEFEKIRPILKASDDQIAAILTPDQQAALKQLEADREKAFSKHGHPWGPPHEGPGGMHFRNHEGGPDDGRPPGPPGEAPAPPPAPPATNAPTK